LERFSLARVSNMVNTASGIAMRLVRPAFAMHPRRFGRGRARVFAMPAPPAWGLSDEFKLFATTFVVGFVFVSILIG
jgi:hypothetical protein